jgi:ABC-type sugar transport system ATPase subunit
MIKIKGLWVDLGDFELEGIDLDIQKGEYFIVLGPTGAGKTILLESIAGIYPLKGGEIWLDGRGVTRFPPEKRRIGFVYQDYALFPHLSVKENISFSLKLRKEKGEQVEEKVRRMAELLRISHLLERNPAT